MIGLLAMALGTTMAMASPTRRIEASATGAQLSAALLPEDVPEYTVCDGDCPPGLGRLAVTSQRLDVAGSTVQARGRVHTDLALIGAIEADVICAVVPVLGAGGLVGVASRGCRVEKLGDGVSPWLRRAVIAIVEPALGVLLEGQLRLAPDYDLLAGARSGLLAPYSPDPALQPATAAGCVQAIRAVSFRDGAPNRLVVAVDVTCG